MPPRCSFSPRTFPSYPRRPWRRFSSRCPKRPSPTRPWWDSCPTAPAAPRLSTGQFHVLTLEGIPEIAGGDDLPAIIADAIDRTPGVLPFEVGDVIVVTQKIVSKAEDAVVDLRTVEPRPEAVEF